MYHPMPQQLDTVNQQKHPNESEVLCRDIVFFASLTAFWVDERFYDWSAKAHAELSTVLVWCALATP
jgi:hypothetical protein